MCEDDPRVFTLSVCVHDSRRPCGALTVERTVRATDRPEEEEEPPGSSFILMFILAPLCALCVNAQSKRNANKLI